MRRKNNSANGERNPRVKPRMAELEAPYRLPGLIPLLYRIGGDGRWRLGYFFLSVLSGIQSLILEEGIQSPSSQQGSDKALHSMDLIGDDPFLWHFPVNRT